MKNNKLNLPKKSWSYADKLYLKQKKNGSKGWCRHLHPLRRVTLIDYENDETIEEMACNLCGKIMTQVDIEKREKDLKKFEDLKNNK